MKIEYWFNWQIGLLLEFGCNYENRRYLCVELPFLSIQIFWFK